MLYENKEYEMSITVDKLVELSKQKYKLKSDLCLINCLAFTKNDIIDRFDISNELFFKLFDRYIIDVYILIDKNTESVINNGTDYHSDHYDNIIEEYKSYIFISRLEYEEPIVPINSRYVFLKYDKQFYTNIYNSNSSFIEYKKAFELRKKMGKI